MSRSSTAQFNYSARFTSFRSRTLKCSNRRCPVTIKVEVLPQTPLRGIFCDSCREIRLELMKTIWEPLLKSAPVESLAFSDLTELKAA
jgi:hypothetical protein